MKQINILKTAVLVCLLVGLFSCNEDKGNYDYVEVNSVDSINGVDNISRELGEMLQIQPKLVFSEGEDENNFSFAWYYHDNGWKLLQEGRNLDIKVENPFSRIQGYTLAYEVINRKTEIAYRKVFTLSVISPFARGYVALCEEDGGFDIDMVALSSKGEFNFYDNVLDMTGSTLPRDGVTPRDIVTFYDINAPDPFARSGDYSVFILTDQYTTRVYPTDFSWKSSYDISNIIEKGSYLDREYIRQGKPVIAQKMTYSYQVNPLTPRMFFYHQEDNGEGNWYLYNTTPALSLCAVQMNRVRPAGDPRYEPAPYIAAATQGAMYFDAGQKKFMYGSLPTVMDMGSANLFYTQSIPAEVSNGAFMYSDPNEGLLQMDWIPGNSSNNYGYAILKQADGSFKYIEFYNSTFVNMYNNTATKIRVSYIPASSNIDDAKFFARTPQGVNRPFLYYVTNDNKVKLADVSSTAATIHDITDQVLKGDGYDEITVFKFTVPESYNIDGSADQTLNAEQALAVGTYNISLGKDKGGKLEFFRQESVTGNLELAKYPDKPTEDGYQIDMSWKDMGRIVGLSYKKQ